MVKLCRYYIEIWSVYEDIGAKLRHRLIRATVDDHVKRAWRAHLHDNWGPFLWGFWSPQRSPSVPCLCDYHHYKQLVLVEINFRRGNVIFYIILQRLSLGIISGLSYFMFLVVYKYEFLLLWYHNLVRVYNIKFIPLIICSWGFGMLRHKKDSIKYFE